MKRFFTFLLLLLICFFTVAQTVTLTFTGRDANNTYVQLNRVSITNYTRGWQKTIFWPDTTLTIKNITANCDDAVMHNSSSIQLSQNHPNPFNGTTDVMMTVADEGVVTLEITDMMNGHIIETLHTSSLQLGVHQVRVTLAATGTYLMTAHQNGQVSSIKMVNKERGSGNSIEYVGMVNDCRGIAPFSDYMEYIGYATVNGMERETEAVMQVLSGSQTITLKMDGTSLSSAAMASGNNIQRADTLKFEKKYKRKTRTSSQQDSSDFRIALSLSPFSLPQFQKGYTFRVGDRTASTPQELQAIYRDLGSTEMYTRIATKRHVTAEDITDGESDENANVHTFDQGIELCRIAAELEIPINPEIMCAYTYMDMDKQQAPRFDEYPEIYALQNGKEWSELTLDEICTVLEAYGAFVGEAILNTGCTVNNWNLGNEANFGFAGISMGLETAVNPKLKKAGTLKKYLAPTFAVWWLKKNVWQYDAQAFASLKRGILSAYAKLGKDASNVKFSTHIATVVFSARCSASYFRCMKKNGYEMETAGISYYPSAPSMSLNKKKLLTKTITKINKKCDLPVFIGEFSYPSGKMEGNFAGWNKKLKGYNKNQQGQADIYADVISWGKTNGMAGIRYWAPDYKGWYAMSMFDFSDKKGTAKIILKNHKELIKK